MENHPEHIALQFNCRFLGLESGSDSILLEGSERNTIHLLEHLCRQTDFWCDYLVSLTATHQIGPPETITVHYHLHSFPKGWKIHVFERKEVSGPGERVVFDTVSHLWKTAEWHERETAELFGIEFRGHPDARNLLLPANWEGFPLRKNYETQEAYHGIKVKF